MNDYIEVYKKCPIMFIKLFFVHYTNNMDTDELTINHTNMITEFHVSINPFKQAHRFVTVPDNFSNIEDEIPTIRLNPVLSFDHYKKFRFSEYKEKLRSKICETTIGNFDPGAETSHIGTILDPKESDINNYKRLKEEYEMKPVLDELFKNKVYQSGIKEVYGDRKFVDNNIYLEIVSKLCKDNNNKFPKNTRKKSTLCLELENVLMSITITNTTADIIVPIIIDEDVKVANLYINYRPYLFEFLKDMKSKYELILYTSLNTVYISAIMAHIPKLANYFDYVLTQNQCVYTNIDYGMKCLDFLLTSRTLSQILLLDISPKSFPAFLYNFLPVPSFQENKDEAILCKLAVTIDNLLSNDLMNIIKTFIKKSL